MPRKPSAATVRAALAALDGLIKIARNEMLTQGQYITPDVVNEELAAAGSVCRGHKACFVGSLWLGGGVEPELRALHSYYSYDRQDTFLLPGTDDVDARGEFLADKPGLRLAYAACNEAARRYIVNHRAEFQVKWNDSYDEAWDEHGYSESPDAMALSDNAAEDLFESGYLGQAGDDDSARELQAAVIRIGFNAKRLIRADKVRA